VGVYHTGLPLNERIENISDYRQGKTNILVSCHALNEGFDVPESEIGIIVAGTSSARQWIQRMGRILRKTPGRLLNNLRNIRRSGRKRRLQRNRTQRV